MVYGSTGYKMLWAHALSSTLSLYWNLLTFSLASRPDMEGGQNGILPRPGPDHRGSQRGTGRAEREAKLLSAGIITEKRCRDRGSYPNCQGDLLRLKVRRSNVVLCKDMEKREGSRQADNNFRRNALRNNIVQKSSFTPSSNTNIITAGKCASTLALCLHAVTWVMWFYFCVVVTEHTPHFSQINCG